MSSSAKVHMGRGGGVWNLEIWKFPMYFQISKSKQTTYLRF